jgi:hypothetical protein
VYPNANADFSGKRIVLKPSHAPLEKTSVGPHLRLVGQDKKPTAGTALTSSVGEGQISKQKDEPTANLIAFPTGTVRYGDAGRPFYNVGLDKGKPWDVDMIATEFRRGFAGIDKLRTEAEWLRIWSSFVERYAERRRGSA